MLAAVTHMWPQRVSGRCQGNRRWMRQPE